MFSGSTITPPDATGFVKALGFSMAPVFQQKKKPIEALEKGLKKEATRVARDHFQNMTKEANPKSDDWKEKRAAGLGRLRSAMPEDLQSRLDQMALVGDPARGTTTLTDTGFTRQNRDSGPRTPEDFFETVITAQDRLQLALENVSAAVVATALAREIALEGPVKVRVDLSTLSRGGGADNLIRARMPDGNGGEADMNLGLDQFACPEGWDPLELDPETWTPELHKPTSAKADEFARTFHKHCGNVKRDQAEDEPFATLGILDVTGMSEAQVAHLLKLVRRIEQHQGKDFPGYNFVVFDFTADPPIRGGQFMAVLEAEGDLDLGF